MAFSLFKEKSNPAVEERKFVVRGVESSIELSGLRRPFNVVPPVLGLFCALGTVSASAG